MMKILLAQSLDNASANIMVIDDILLEPGDVVRRQKAATVISEIKSSGASVIKERNLKVTAATNGVVIDVRTQEKDELGRETSVVFCETGGQWEQPQLQKKALEDIQKFASKIGRTLDDAYLFELGKSSKVDFANKKVIILAISISLTIILFYYYALAPRQ